MEFIEACRKVIAIDSSPAHGTSELCEFLSELGTSFDLDVTVQKGVLKGVPQSNIILRADHQTDQEFMLQTHLDTGDPGNYGLWAETGKNPFDAVISDNRIYGLGAAKSKLDFLCKLYALRKFKDKKFRLSPVVVGTYGQQLGMAGAVQLMRYNTVRAKYALVGEPTNLSMVSASKGVAVIDFQIPFSESERKYRTEHDELESSSSQSKMFSGVAASSSDPSRGENAIEKLLADLNNKTAGVAVLDVDGGVNVHAVPVQGYLEYDRFEEIHSPVAARLHAIYSKIMELKEQFTHYSDPSFNPPTSTLNLGIIRTYEDHIQLSCSCRLVPTRERGVYDKWMREVQDICEKSESSFRMSEFKRPFKMEESHPLVVEFEQVLCSQELSRTQSLQAKSNEANVFSRFGVDCLIFGPGEVGGNAHTPAESVDVDDLEISKKVYESSIERVCL